MVLQFPRLKTLLVIFLFVVGHGPAPVRMIDTETLKAAASANITPGSTITGDVQQELIKSGYRMTAAIFVENWTRFPLVSPSVYHRYGVSFTGNAPADIQPGMKEVFTTRKKSLATSGTTGVASWLVQKARRRFVLMWSAPYDFNFYSNWMALGLTPKHITEVSYGPLWYDRMYYKSSYGHLEFTRHKTSITHSDDQFEIEGTMTQSHHVVMNVVFKPVKDKDLAPKLLEALRLST
uniref:Coluporin-7 n=1 Tax=Colubraria reticulata TaxID=604273 RepID=A0A499RTU4_9CAEN|nr:coluporin-7 [Colubraria reticulata]